VISTEAWSWQRPTRRLTFREIGTDDADLLVALDADPQVRQFLFRTPPPRAVVVDRIIPALRHEYRRHPGFGRWIAFDDGNSFVGWFGLHVHGDPRRPSLGYRLARSAWGKGLATEAGRALIERAFTDLGADRVTAQTMAVNERSRRVMDRCGMRCVRAFVEHFDDPLPGTDQGEVEYVITKADWLQTQRGGD
jgi:RimJ/RimL family protein N-acetyltransferase